MALGFNKVFGTIKKHEAGINALALSPCGQLIASGGDDRMLVISKTENFEVVT